MSTVLTPNGIMESDVNDSVGSFTELLKEGHPNISLRRPRSTTDVEDHIIDTPLPKLTADKPAAIATATLANGFHDGHLLIDSHRLPEATTGDKSSIGIDSASNDDSLNDSASGSSKQTSSSSGGGSSNKKSVIFDTVTVYHFTRSQGFSSIPSQGGSTLGMKRRHFLRRKLSVDLFEEVRRRSRREILIKLRYDKIRPPKRATATTNEQQQQPFPTSNTTTTNSTATATTTTTNVELHCSSVSSTAASSGTSSGSTSSTASSSASSSTASSSSSSSSTSNATTSDSDDESFSDYSDISDSELENDIFVQPIGVKLRRSLLRASGVQRIDPSEKWECKTIRDSRDRSGCSCVNQCIPGLCECIMLGVNCHVDRISYPCGCISDGCQNPQGRTEFDIKRVKGHLTDTLCKSGIG